jgi:hypothetical protein
MLPIRPLRSINSSRCWPWIVFADVLPTLQVICSRVQVWFVYAEMGIMYKKRARRVRFTYLSWGSEENLKTLSPVDNLRADTPCIQNRSVAHSAATVRCLLRICEYNAMLSFLRHREWKDALEKEGTEDREVALTVVSCSSGGQLLETSWGSGSACRFWNRNNGFRWKITTKRTCDCGSRSNWYEFRSKDNINN